MMQCSLQRTAGTSLNAGASRPQAFRANVSFSRTGCAHARPSRQQLAVHCQAAAAAEVEAAEQTVAAPARKPTLLSQPAPATYAIVEISGKQMFVEPGKWYVTNRLKGVEVGDTIQLGRVLGHKANGEFKFGQPYLEGVTVEAQILEEFRGPKVIVYKMKPKKHYRRKNGHRQELTKFMVTKVEAN